MKFRAKFNIASITDHGNNTEELRMYPVTNGKPEDNSFSKWTPAGKMDITITNPELVGKFKVGDQFHLNFEKAE